MNHSSVPSTARGGFNSRGRREGTNATQYLATSTRNSLVNNNPPLKTQPVIESPKVEEVFINSTQTVLLDPMEFKNWSKEQVCSLLCSSAEVGGAELSFDIVQPIYKAESTFPNFLDFVLLLMRYESKHDQFIIVSHIAQQLQVSLRDVGVSISTQLSHHLVLWVEQKIRARCYDWWPISKIKEELGKVGCTEHDMESICQPISKWLPMLPSAVHDKVTTWVNCMKFQVQINPYFKPKVSKRSTPSFIVNARSDVKFDFLRNLKSNPKKLSELEKLVGQNIELPQLELKNELFVPKEYNPDSKYLLTRQRFEILKGVIEGEECGFVFSGPHGISKSYTMYLIASYAIVNSFPLIYVPKCLHWVDQYKKLGNKGANDFLLECALYWNSDILDAEILYQLENSDDIIPFFGKTFNMPNFHSMFYLFDDHNEIFINNVQGTDYFRSYTCWTGATSSRISITIYSGSENSKFELNLPGGEESKIIRIEPPTFEEFVMLANEFNLHLDEASLRKVEYATGRIPRELLTFSKTMQLGNLDAEVESFVTNRISFYTSKLINLFENCSILEKKLMLAIIHNLFNPTSPKQRFLVAEPFYYQGLVLYQARSNEIYPINEAARRALFSFYEHCEEDIEHLKYINKLWTQNPVENLLIWNEYKIGKSNCKYNLLQQKTIVSENIEYQIMSKASFGINSLASLSCLSRNRWPSGISVLFTPDAKDFSFDYMIVSYFEEKIQIVLKKSTISSVCDHYSKGDFTKLLNPRFKIEENELIFCNKASTKVEYSLFELIVNSILGFGNGSEKKMFTYTKNRKQLNRKFFVEGIEISWFYVYESFVPQAEQNTSIDFGGINYRNREELEQNLNNRNKSAFSYLIHSQLPAISC